MGKGAKRTKRKVGEVRRDAGTEAAQRKRELYGTDGSDAIGRAYRSGLLGEDGQSYLRSARAFNRSYVAVFGRPKAGCTLAPRSGGGRDVSLETKDWVIRKRRIIDRMGAERKQAFDELCLHEYPDNGPAWLDQILLSNERIAYNVGRLKMSRCEVNKAAFERRIEREVRKIAPCFARLAKALEVLDELSD